jgi:hypothetical protein
VKALMLAILILSASGCATTRPQLDCESSQGDWAAWNWDGGRNKTCRADTLTGGMEGLPASGDAAAPSRL